MVVEYKSRGHSLEDTYSQAVAYFAGLKDHELPRYVLVSDFARFRLYDLEDANLGSRAGSPLTAGLLHFQYPQVRLRLR